jgi:hypothetical protein
MWVGAENFQPVLYQSRDSCDLRIARSLEGRDKSHPYCLRPSGSLYLRLLNFKWGARSRFMGQMGHMPFEQA